MPFQKRNGKHDHLLMCLIPSLLDKHGCFLSTIQQHHTLFKGENIVVNFTSYTKTRFDGWTADQCEPRKLAMGSRAHYIIEYEVQWKPAWPFWLATQQLQQNDRLGGNFLYTMMNTHGAHLSTMKMCSFIRSYTLQ